MSNYTNVSAVYYCVLRDWDGKAVALFDNWISLSYTKVVNDVGSFVFSIDGRDSRASLFKLDYILEVRRGVPGSFSGWVRHFVGLCRTFKSSIAENGGSTLEVRGTDVVDLLARRCIGWKGGTIRADKDKLPAETAMKQYVSENCAGLATTKPYPPLDGRFRDGVMPHFVVDADGGRGKQWTGSKPYENLLDVIKSIASFSGVDFSVYTDIDESIGLFQHRFVALPDGMGVDRTTVGLDSATGLNAAGYRPIIFGLQYDNTSTLEYEEDHSAEANAVFVLGSGEVSLRNVFTVENLTDQALSPWNDREISRPGSGGTVTVGSTSVDVASLFDAIGKSILQQEKYKENFNIMPRQVQNALYGRDYYFGDKVTAVYGDIVRHKRVTTVAVSVSASEIDVVNITLSDPNQGANIL